MTEAFGEEEYIWFLCISATGSAAYMAFCDLVDS